LTQARFVLRAAAQRDLNAFVDSLEDEAGKDLAYRFVDAAQSSFQALAETPGLGATVSSHNLALTGLRKWRVAGFPDYLIFYRPEENRVRIFRILHGASDWWATLDIAT
jgi:toxin ParE1/3/4